jgi:hypothetical protein
MSAPNATGCRGVRAGVLISTTSADEMVSTTAAGSPTDHLGADNVNCDSVAARKRL